MTSTGRMEEDISLTCAAAACGWVGGVGWAEHVRAAGARLEVSAGGEADEAEGAVVDPAELRALRRADEVEEDGAAEHAEEDEDGDRRQAYAGSGGRGARWSGAAREGPQFNPAIQN